MRGRHDDRLGTQPPRLHGPHRGADAERPRLIARRQHDAATDDHRAPAQLRVITLLDRRIERIEIGVEDGRIDVHEHMFARRTDATPGIVAGNVAGSRTRRER